MAISAAFKIGNCFHAFSRLRFDYARSGPVQGHACVSPSLDVAADPADRTVHVLE
jgi:hypothetical protein